MLLDIGTDQQFFQETTARCLEERASVAELRRLRDDPAGVDLRYWRQSAELGWTSLLVSEARGGGSLSEHSIADLALVAYEFGRHGAPGPLLVSNVVAATLGDDAAEVLGRHPVGILHRHLVERRAARGRVRRRAHRGARRRRST